VYIRRATEEQQIYVDAQTRTSVLSPQPPASPPSTSDLGKALSSLVSPVQSAVSAVVGTQGSDAYGKIVDLEKQAVTAYQQLATLSPKDAVTQYRLAQVAQGAGDAKTSLAAYQRFLVLAPDDPLAAAARKQIKQLKAQLKTTATPVSTHK
jgi:tetratricopeptide (TPR) repeat protein